MQIAGEGESALSTETAMEIIQVKGPDKGSSIVVLFQVVDLWVVGVSNKLTENLDLF